MLSINCQQIWNIEKGKDRDKEKVVDRPAKAQLEKQRRGARARDKKQRKHFWLEEQHKKFCCRGEEMRNPTDHQCKLEMSGSKKEKSEQ